MFRQPIVNLGAALGRPLRMLIVEDSQDDVVLLLRALRVGGFEPSYQVVETSAAMRELLELHEWDLVTSDHAMPQFSGAAALALARGLRPDVPFVIVSGEIDLDVAVSLIKGGAEDYVQKSQLPRLPQVIERVLQAAEGRRQRQSSELALQVSEARYRRLFETAQDGILIVDADTGQIEDVNPFLTQLVGYSREQYLDKKLWEIGPFKDSEASKSAFLELQDKGYIRFENIPLHTSAGGHVDVEFVSNVYTVGSKRVIQCNIRDITERRRAESEVRTLNAELEQRVAQRTAQVDVLNKELQTFNYSDSHDLRPQRVEQRTTAQQARTEELARSEGETRTLNGELEQRVRFRTAELEAINKDLEAFTYSVSHDLRAPLRHIAGFSNLLLDEYSSSLPPPARHYLERIQQGTRRMGLLVDDFLKLALVGRQELSLQLIGLDTIVREVISNLKSETEGRLIEWKIGKMPHVEGDAALLKQVFENLLSNALKYSRPRAQAVIEIGQESSGGDSNIFVRDNGVGFSMKYVDKLFGVFQRLHRSEDFEGTGIGLATVHRIVQKHHGRIWAHAEIDKGATFYFNLGIMKNNQPEGETAMAGEQS